MYIASRSPIHTHNSQLVGSSWGYRGLAQGHLDTWARRSRGWHQQPSGCRQTTVLPPERYVLKVCSDSSSVHSKRYTITARLLHTLYVYVTIKLPESRIFIIVIAYVLA